MVRDVRLGLTFECSYFAQESEFFVEAVLGSGDTGILVAFHQGEVHFSKA